MPNFINNNTFEGQTGGNSVTPTGWTALQNSPDTNQDGGFEWSGSYMPSNLNAATGTNYVTLFGKTAYAEEIGTTLNTSVIAGQNYRFTFDFYVNDTNGTTNQPGATTLQLVVGGQLVQIPISSIGVTAPYWKTASVVFTATTTTTNMSIRSTADVGAYNSYTGIAIDNVNFDVGPNYIVEGTAGNDTIDSSYLLDPQGDRVDNNDGVGGTNNDSIVAGAGNDSIVAGLGNDIIYGGTGDDTGYGGAGDDWASMGDGNDSFGSFGADSAGNDTIYGDAGNDYLIGGGGNDVVYGGTDNDTLSGGIGNDTVYGGDGADVFMVTEDHQGDTIFGGEGGNDNDVIDFANYLTTDGVTVTATGNEAGTYAYTGGSTGTTGVYSEIEGVSGTNYNDAINLGASGSGDTIWGNAGNDTLTGGSGADTIYGGNDNDNIIGGAGNDVLNGDWGNDTVYGGDGDDVMSNSQGTDVQYGGAGNDTMGGGLGNDSYYGGTGDDYLHDSGGSNTVEMGSGNDTVLTDWGNDTILGEGGNDSLDGGVNDDLIFGGAGNDIVIGGDGRDVLHGDAGADLIYGGADADLIYGGAGDVIDGGETTTTGGTDNDTLVVEAGSGVTYGGGNNEAGTIALASGGTLTFSNIENIVFAGPVDGTSGDDTMNIGYTDLNGDQIDGTDGVNDTIYGYGGNDTINAGAGNDLIYGGTGNDVLRAMSGNDTLYGDAGDDDLQAGTGNDILYGGDGSDLIHTFLDTSTDTVVGGETGESIIGDVLNVGTGTTATVVNFTGNEAGTVSAGTSNVSFSEIETIWTAAGNDTINASATTIGTRVWAGDGADFITGGAGNDVLLGQGGNDEIFAGAGADSVDGGLGDDQLYGGDDNDSLYGGTGNDYMQGDAGNDLVEGGIGDDFIRGDAGNDLVYGGAGNDSVYGGAGNDQVYGGDGDDQIYGGYGDDTVYGGAGNDTVTGSGETDVVYGDDGDDFIQGSYGNDTLYGGAGNDTMLGEEDADTFYAGAGDYVDGYETVTTGTDNDTLQVSGIDHIVWDVLNPENGVVHYAGGGTLNFYNIENVFVDGVQVFAPNFIVSGTAGDDLIDATYTGDPEGDRVDAADNLSGNNDDLIQAGAGNDTVLAGYGKDVIYGGSGDDSVLGGVGDDYVSGDAGNDVVSGGDGADEIFGGAGNDQLSGEAGDDYIDGDAGDDTVDGGDGNDELYGDLGDDIVDGGADNDTVYGDEGNDLLAGGDGDDVLYGGIGADTVDGGVGDDSVQGYLGDDLIAGGVGNDTLDGGEDNDMLLGQEGNDFLLGGDGDDSISGGIGDDTLWSGDGNDTLNGDAGNDIMSGGDGDDRFVLTDGFGTDDIDGSATGQTIGDTLDLTGLTGNVTVDLTAFDPEAGTVRSGADQATFREIENIELGDGTETLVLADGSGADVVSGFTIPTDLGGGVFSGMDQLDVSGLIDAGGDPVNVNDVTVTDDGNGNAVLTFPNGESLTLIGVDPADLADPAVLVAMGIPAETLDFIVEGTSGDDLINVSYVGDPEGDMIDASDNLAGNNDDLVTAGAGNDTVFSGNGNDTVYGENGDDVLQSGNGDDLLYGGDGNDQLFSENGSDTIYGGAGNDSVYASTGGDLVYGGDGDDSLQGGGYAATGHDTLYGDAGNDTLTGGMGNDQLYGGADNDTFLMLGPIDNDTIYGGETGGDHDTLDLSGVGAGVSVTIMGNEQGWATSGGPGTVVFNEVENFVLTSNDDVFQGAAATAGAEVHAGAGNDNLTGGQGADSLFGDEGDDSILGAADDDYIDGGAGNDVLQGGTGDDTVYGSAGDDTLLLGDGDNLGDGGDGNDWIAAANCNDTLYGGAGRDTIIGAGGDDLVYGGDGNDEIRINNGNDTAYGGADADTFIVQGPLDTNTIIGGETGDDNDTLDLQYYTDSGVTLTFTADEAGVANGVSGTTTFSEIELFNLTMQDDLVDASADTAGVSIFANDGDDTLVGGSGNDLLSGGDGDDTFVMNDNFGNDSINGGETGEAFGDKLDLTGVTGPLTIDLTNANPENGTVSNGTDQLSFANIENIVLGSGVDTLVLADGSGADTVNGFTIPTDLGGGLFSGVDQIDVSGMTDAGGDPINVADVTVSDDGNGNAVLTFPNGESLTLIGVAPADVNHPAVLVAMGIPVAPDLVVDGTSGNDVMGAGFVDIQGDQIDGSDGLNDVIMGYGGNDSITAGFGNDTIYGGTGDDTIWGETGENLIYGGDGNDYLNGGDGDDSIEGGVGNDAIYAGWGDDTVDGGAGDDYIVGDMGDHLILGGAGNDSITTGPGNDTIYGGAGDDSVWGLGGSDLIYGGAGNDTLLGFADNDTLFGDAGNDYVNGGAGNDLLNGGAGADYMSGEDDRDTFVIGLGEGNGDVVDGGEGGDDYDVLDLTAYGHPGTNIIYDPMNLEDGTVEFLDAFGNVTGTMSFTKIESVVACFTPGAMVLTDLGEVAVEQLQLGDQVLTRDNGYQPVRWTGRRNLSHAELLVEPRFNPVFIAKGALGNGLPERDMAVSPQHRMLMAGPRAELLFGEYEVLVAAKHLVGLAGIEQRVSKAASYIHILFDQHEIVRADGAWSESFQPGDQTLDGMEAGPRAEIIALFPELAHGGGFASARLTLKAREARVLVAAP